MPRNSTDRMRAHVLVPEDLLREVDALVGPRKRSEFFVEAAREKAKRMKLRNAAHALVGSLRECHIPEWDTPESTSAWVRALREESDKRAAESLRTKE